MKATAYCRVSTFEQSEEGVSLRMQEDRIRAFCVANDYELVGCFTETMSGGKATNRPQLQQALESVCKTKGVLVVYSLSRLARSVRDTLVISERLEKAGANLASLNERIDTSSAIGKMVFRLLSTLNEFERDQLAERTTAAMSHLRRQGRRISSRIPLGFDLSSDGESLIENPVEQETLRLIYEWNQMDMPVATIARKLQAQGAKTKAGGQWYSNTVKQILHRQEKLAA
jgi:site-specific DNA recombinase